MTVPLRVEPNATYSTNFLVMLQKVLRETKTDTSTSDVNRVLLRYIETTIHQKKKLSHDLTSKMSYFGHFY